VALIVLMTILGSLVIMIVMVALMVVAILVPTMLLVAQFMRSGKMSHLLFLWLLFVLGNLLKNASRFVCCLPLINESNEFE
jgi:hypothetical protein